MATENPFFEELSALLAGFVPAKLADAAERIEKQQRQKPFERASAVFVLAQALRSISSPWDDDEQGIETEIYQRLRTRYESRMQALVAALAKDNDAEIRSAADDLAAELLK